MTRHYNGHRRLRGEQNLKAGRKPCSVCSVEKPLTEYHKRRAAVDGVQACCKVCQISRVKRSTDPQLQREYRVRYVAANRTRIAERQRRYYARHRAEILSQRRAAYRADRV